MANVDYSQHLGYPGDDTWPALFEHEAAHSWIAEQLGQPYSPTLWAVAHHFAPGTAPYEEQLHEEAVVLGVQRYMNTGHIVDALLHPAVLPHLMAWKRRFRLLFPVPSPSQQRAA